VTFAVLFRGYHTAVFIWAHISSPSVDNCRRAWYRGQYENSCCAWLSLQYHAVARTCVHVNSVVLHCGHLQRLSSTLGHGHVRARTRRGRPSVRVHLRTVRTYSVSAALHRHFKTLCANCQVLSELVFSLMATKL